MTKKKEPDKGTIAGRMGSAAKRASTKVKVVVHLKDTVVELEYPGIVPHTEAMLNQARRQVAVELLRKFHDLPARILSILDKGDNA